uniref:Uncharacterized protein n=1 Tax=Picea sitchensis TaxID=3332 RepID=A9NPY2_PICSI|nr:unknown [Picea sitchensis]
MRISVLRVGYSWQSIAISFFMPGPARGWCVIHGSDRYHRIYLRFGNEIIYAEVALHIAGFSIPLRGFPPAVLFRSCCVPLVHIPLCLHEFIMMGIIFRYLSRHSQFTQGLQFLYYKF